MLEKNHSRHRKLAFYSSFWVTFFTSLSFLGFFARDYLMVKVYGLGYELDAFYLVNMLPTFMVTIFCIPFGQSVVPKLKISKNLDDNSFPILIRNYSFFIFLLCLFLCLFTYIISDFAFLGLHYFGWTDLISNPKKMQLAVLPLLLLSGLVVLCNSILAVNEQYIYPIIAQLAVPIIAIAFLFIFSNAIGVYAVIFGMIIGQILNFFLVNNRLKQNNFFIFPFTSQSSFSKNLFFQKDYIHLISIAFFSASILLVNTYIASSLGGGAVAIFILGTKFSLFLIGVLTAVFTSVLLPYLSNLSLYKDKDILNKETFYLLLASTFIFIPFCLLIFINADFISEIIFKYIVIESSSILGIASVIKYSVIQMPFWVFSAIIFKHANAIQRVGIIFLVSMVMLSLNIFLSLFLIKVMNVGGLSLATTISSAIAASLILINYGYKKYLKLFQCLIVFGIWFIFGIIIIGLNFYKLMMLIEKL